MEPSQASRSRKPVPNDARVASRKRSAHFELPLKLEQIRTEFLSLSVNVLVVMVENRACMTLVEIQKSIKKTFDRQAFVPFLKILLDKFEGLFEKCSKVHKCSQKNGPTYTLVLAELLKNSSICYERGVFRMIYPAEKEICMDKLKALKTEREYMSVGGIPVHICAPPNSSILIPTKCPYIVREYPHFLFFCAETEDWPRLSELKKMRRSLPEASTNDMASTARGGLLATKEKSFVANVSWPL